MADKPADPQADAGAIGARGTRSVLRAAEALRKGLGYVYVGLPAATADRVARSLMEMTQGYLDHPREILARRFSGEAVHGYSDLIALTGIDFTSLCEHHVLPFVGTATVGYIPGEEGEVVGLSKLARLVDCYSRRFQIQERMTAQIADALDECLQPKGVGVVVKATHACMACRGVRKTRAVMVTSAMRGVLLQSAGARAEFLKLTEGGER